MIFLYVGIQMSFTPTPPPLSSLRGNKKKKVDFFLLFHKYFTRTCTRGENTEKFLSKKVFFRVGGIFLTFCLTFLAGGRPT